MTIQVKEKKVELIELFYDLIYVYAISRLTLTIEEPEHGVIGWTRMGQYLVMCFVILQAWLYLTNYVNRYGTWKWYEYALTGINMTAAVYMANTISTEWDIMATTFNIAMLIMLLCVAGMYFIQFRLKTQDPGAAKNTLIILGAVCTIYFVAFLVSLFDKPILTDWIDVTAVLTGAFLPFFLQGDFDHSIISFPHLVERVELITIITFGEGVVGMTEYFDVLHFTMKPVLVFVLVLALFGCYVTQIHYLCNHHRVERALPLMFSHYFIVIAVNLITVALKYLENHEADRLFTVGLMSAALVLFFVSVFADRVYYHERFSLTRNDLLLSSGAILAGIAVMFLARSSIYGVLLGALLPAAAIAALLIHKYKTTPAEEVSQ